MGIATFRVTRGRGEVSIRAVVTTVTIVKVQLNYTLKHNAPMNGMPIGPLIVA